MQKSVPNCNVSFANGEHHQAYGHVTLTMRTWPYFGHALIINVTWPYAWWSSPQANETSQSGTDFCVWLCYMNNQKMGQCPTWWSPCRTLVAPSVKRCKVWLTPTTRCREITLPRRETRWNLQECLKLPDGSQPLVGRSSPYCGDTWRTYCCLKSFLSDCRYVP